MNQVVKQGECFLLKRAVYIAGNLSKLSALLKISRQTLLNIRKTARMSFSTQAKLEKFIEENTSRKGPRYNWRVS